MVDRQLTIPEEPRPDTETRMSLGEHLEELRRRIIYALLGLTAGTAASLVFAGHVIRFLEQPYWDAMARFGKTREELAVLTVGAGFDIYMKTALYCGLLIGSPWILYQLWAFVSAGLYPRERRMVHLSIPFFVLLFAAGGAFFYYLVAVPAIMFLVHFDVILGVRNVVTLQSHLGLMTEMMLVFGMAFQTPLVILLLAKIGLVGMGTLRKYRRHAIVVILLFAAIFAPGDVVSMFALAIPMWLLYELGVVLAYFLVLKKRAAEESAQEDEDSALEDQERGAS
jgi:sec-independent protein translocase protein TatC